MFIYFFFIVSHFCTAGYNLHSFRNQDIIILVCTVFLPDIFLINCCPHMLDVVGVYKTKRNFAN